MNLLWNVEVPQRLEVLWYIGVIHWLTRSEPGFNPTIALYFCPSVRHFIHIADLDPGQVYEWGPGRMRMVLRSSLHVRACQMATGRNAPYGVEIVHCECWIGSESNDQGNNILWSTLILIAKVLYIKTGYYYYYHY